MATRTPENQAAGAAYIAYNQAMGLDLESCEFNWQQLCDYRPDIVAMWILVVEAVIKDQ